MKKKSSSATPRTGNGYKCREEVLIDWEVRPGGLLVQRRSAVGSAASGAMISVKVSHDSYHREVTVPAQSSFGDLKTILAHETGLEPKEQRLLFKGKEKNDDECLHIAGVEDKSKIILLEDPASKERKIEEMKKNQSKAYEAIDRVREEVDTISDKVSALEAVLQSGIKVADNEFIVLIELLMVELLKLDSIEAEGDARLKRRSEVHRVQSFVEALDDLKVRNSARSSNCSKGISVTSKWDMFGSGVGGISSQNALQSSTKVTQNWEHFD